MLVPSSPTRECVVDTNALQHQDAQVITAKHLHEESQRVLIAAASLPPRSDESIVANNNAAELRSVAQLIVKLPHKRR